MMEELIYYLVASRDYRSVEKRFSPLIGVSQVEQQAIIEVLSEDPVRPFVMWN